MFVAYAKCEANIDRFLYCSVLFCVSESDWDIYAILLIAEEFIAFKTKDSGNERAAQQLRIVKFMMYLDWALGAQNTHSCAARHSQQQQQWRLLA